MKIRRSLTLAIALVSFGCAESSGPSGPTPVASIERQATVGEFPLPQPLNHATDLESETEFDPFPAEGELGLEFPAELEGTEDDSEVEIGDTGQSLAAPEFAVPGKPTNVRVTVRGLVVTMTWGPAPAGTAGMPTRYLVYCSCTGKTESVGILVFRKVWTAKAPGTYTGFVLGGNSKGSGPTVNFKVAVGYDGTYTSAVTQTASFTKKIPGGSCTWRITLKGTVTVVIAGATAGTTRVAGSLIYPKPSAKCSGGATAFTSNAKLAFSATGFSSAHTMGFVKGKFEGSFVGATIKGFLRAAYSFGTGRYDIPVTLKKT